MKSRLTALLCFAFMMQLILFSCAGASAEEAEIDYAASIQPDLSGLCAEVTVHSYVDGDTTHFQVPGWPDDDGVLRARYLACNTPESTGKIEEYGKAASRFTREMLESAEKILIESDTDKWVHDGTGTRFLVWVWYQPQGSTAWRNLNIELLQNGLAIANSSGQNRYGETCLAAIAQARVLKKNIYSGQKDPDFFYGNAIELTLRELRLHPEEYEGKKVAFTGIITLNHDNAVYLESYDAETDMYYGITAYYGFNMSGGGLEVLHVGNEARIVGTMQYYESGQSWQISGMTYRMMKPDDPGNIRIISQGHSPSWKEINPKQFCNETIIETESGPETRDFAELTMDTSVSMIGYAELTESDLPDLYRFELSDRGPYRVTVYAPSIPNDDINNRLVAVKGFVHQYDGNYCIRVYNPDHITYLD